MPFSILEHTFWDFDPDFMASLPGAQKLQDWFGFATNFHDDEVVSCVLGVKDAELKIISSRMTDKTDAKGFFIADRHAMITIHLIGLTGMKIEASFPTQMLELAFRRVCEDAKLPCNTLVETGQVELAFDDIYGGRGSFFAKSVELEFEAVEPR